MANWLKEEIADFGKTVDKSIDKAKDDLGVTLKEAVADASENIGKHIDVISQEINKQRHMTRQDVEALIDYAALKFGAVLDDRIEKAKEETAQLVTDKLNEVRGQLSDAATQQKQVAVRNASVAASAAVFVAILSLAYNKLLHGEIDLLVLFRVSLLALAVGHAVILVFGLLGNYMKSSQDKKNIIIVGAQYLGVFKPKGLLAHTLVFIFTVVAWVAISYWDKVLAIFPMLKHLLG